MLIIDMSFSSGQIDVSHNLIAGKVQVAEYSLSKSVLGHYNEKDNAFFHRFFNFLFLTQASANDSHITEYMAPLASLIIAE